MTERTFVSEPRMLALALVILSAAVLFGVVLALLRLRG
jgi:hypothetical protein